MKNKILGRIEAVEFMIIAYYIFKLIIDGKYPMLFNPKYIMLTISGANLLMVAALYLFVYPSKSSDYFRVIIYGILAFFCIYTPIEIIRPDFLLQFPF